ncbi:hypothetical protein QJS10_CPA01g01209 [Acorus calamus]|uniref:DUF4408 domain-containing protein n=1 Tax=Acorus calamus TaxID=4465 RepID=A0AAV9FMV3_ACOCL|nr:hypothetical protein QJS10_CPA01g01209 [Acorus calamus]
MDQLFGFDSVKAEKSTALKRYRRIQKLRNVFRAAELLSAVFFFSWFSARIPFAVRISGDYLRRFSAVLVSPRFVFLLGNAIVLTLFAKSGQICTSTSASDSGDSGDRDFYGEFVNSQKSAAPEEVVYHDKGVCEESVSPVPDRKHPYGRSMSEGASADHLKEACRELGRKAETEAEMEEEEAEVGMSNEEFRRTIEAFIEKKQINFQREELMAVISTESDGPDLMD